MRFPKPVAHPTAFRRSALCFRRDGIGGAGASLRGQGYKKGSEVSQVFSRNLGVTPSVGGKPTRLCKTPGSILGLVLQKVVFTNLESVKASTVDIVDVDRPRESTFVDIDRRPRFPGQTDVVKDVQPTPF